jgi:hypothetical protein
VTADVHYLTKKFCTNIQSNPYRHDALPEEDLASTIDTLKNEDFDYLIDLHHNVARLK